HSAAAPVRMLNEHENLLFHAARFHLKSVIAAADDVECSEVLRTSTEASLASEFQDQGVQTLWWTMKSLSGVTGAFSRCLSCGDQRDAAGLACGSVVHDFCIRGIAFGPARLQ